MKNAVILCGPPRYYKSSILKIKKYDKNADIYLFLWREDAGSRRRNLNDEIDLDFINQYCKSFTIQSPPNKSDVDTYSIPFDSDQSMPLNTISMFYSIKMCLQSVEASLINYSKVIRLRTDMILLRNIFGDKIFDDDTLLVSKNYIIRNSFISDHLMVGKFDIMKKLWFFQSLSHLIDDLKKNNNNPEKILSLRVSRHKIKTKRLYMRYKDYQIFYNPFVKHDPSWVKPINISRRKIKQLFDSEFENFSSDTQREINSLISKGRDLQNRSLFKRVTDRIIRYLNGK